MAMTQVEAAKLTNDVMLQGVIETIVKESQLLQLLPFMDVNGTAITYNREATMPAASFYNVGDTWAEATPTFTQVTQALKIMGGDADVDNFLQQTYANPNDLEAEVRRRGFCTMVLETGCNNAEARALYESEGYFPIPKFLGYVGIPISRCYAKWA